MLIKWSFLWLELDDKKDWEDGLGDESVVLCCQVLKDDIWLVPQVVSLQEEDCDGYVELDEGFVEDAGEDTDLSW